MDTDDCGIKEAQAFYETYGPIIKSIQKESEKTIENLRNEIFKLNEIIRNKDKQVWEIIEYSSLKDFNGNTLLANINMIREHAWRAYHNK